MTLLTSSPKPSTLLATTSQRNVLTIFSLAFAHSLYVATIFPRLLSTTTLFVVFRAYFLSLILLRQSFYASQVLLLQCYYASALLLKQLFFTAKQTMKLGWKETERIRNRLFFEFMVFVLGSGNGLFLLVFWPGWIVVFGGIWVVSRIYG